MRLLLQTGAATAGHSYNTMNLGLKDRTAIVAAASSGLGAATAHLLASEGANLIINSRDPAKLEETAASIRSATGARVVPVPGDVTDEAVVAQLIQSAQRELGRLDILIANAGGPPAGFFDDFNADDYRKAVELNLISTINLCRHAVPTMRERRWGRIVAVTSIAAKQPVENLILSNTARAGVLGFMKSLSNQVATLGITANTVCPGYHFTERVKTLGAAMAARESVAVDEIYSRWAESTPMKRIGDPMEFASMVVFLCSEQASYITGTAIAVDGGATKSIF